MAGLRYTAWAGMKPTTEVWRSKSWARLRMILSEVIGCGLNIRKDETNSTSNSDCDRRPGSSVAARVVRLRDRPAFKNDRRKSRPVSAVAGSDQIIRGRAA